MFDTTNIGSTRVTRGAHADVSPTPAELRKAGVQGPMAYDKANERIVIGGPKGANTIYLGAFYREHIRLPRRERKKHLEQRARTMLVDENLIPEDLDEAREHLRPKIWVRAALEKATDLEPAIPDYWARWIYADLVFGEDSVGLSRLSHLPDEGNPGWQTDFFRGLVRVILARLLEPRETPDSTARLDSALARTQRREAAFLFGAALKESPGNRMVLFELGTDLERLGLRDSAMGVFRRLLTIDTLNAVAMNYLGYMLVEDNRDLVYAGALLDRALALDPENPAYLDSKGWWHYRMGNFPAAEVELKKALERMPRDPTVREHLSIIRKLLGEKETVNGADAP